MTTANTKAPLIYFGAAVVESLNEQLVHRLSSQRFATREATFTVEGGDPPDGKSILIALPIAFGEPTFRVGGCELPGGLDAVKDLIVQDLVERTFAAYRLWQGNVGLGETTIAIT